MYNDYVKPLEEKQKQLDDEMDEIWRNRWENFSFPGFFSAPASASPDQELKRNIDELKKLEGQLSCGNELGPLEEFGLSIIKGKQTPEAILQFNPTEKINAELLKQRSKKLFLLSHPDKNSDKPVISAAIFCCVTSAINILKASLPKE